jgi:transcriptional regulator with XRE-family HTH domain
MERDWTQPQMAKMLNSKGIAPMGASTIAKIEAGTRSVRINEAVAIADLFEISLDSLLGRKQLGKLNQLAQDLLMLRSVADRYVVDLRVMATEIIRRVPDAGLIEVPQDSIEQVREINSDSDLLWQDLDAAVEHLNNIRDGAAKILDGLADKQKDAAK